MEWLHTHSAFSRVRAGAGSGPTSMATLWPSPRLTSAPSVDGLLEGGRPCRHADSAARCTTRKAPDRHQSRSGALLGLLEEGDSYTSVVSGASVAAVLAVWGLLPLLNAK